MSGAAEVVMPAAEIALFAAIALAAIGTAGLFAGLETGMYTMSLVRLSVRASRGDKSAAKLERENARPRRLLSTLLVANAIAGWLASFGVSQILDGLGYGPLEVVLLDLVILIPLVFVFGEMLPKDLFRVHADRWMPRFAGFLHAARLVLCSTGLVPVVVGLGAIATRLFGGRSVERTELRARVAAMLAEGAGSEGLSETQLGFADRVFTMREVTVGQEMRPWRSVASVPEGCSGDQRARSFLQSSASRLPVVAADGRVLGTVAAVDHLAAPEAPNVAIMQPVLHLASRMSALEAIQAMRRERVQLAIVADRPDRPLGIVSMKDLVEPLVGDLVAW
jgi:CBS domain containing-hemolysin-like protein